jgi:hypothetical protein
MDYQESLTLQLHYYFSNKETHAMNAKVHNDCDKHFINALQLLNKYLDSPFEVIVFAKEEGGILDHYKIAIKDPLILIILTTLISSTTQQFFTSNFPPAINVTEQTKNKLTNLANIKELIRTGALTPEEFEYITSKDKDLRKLKSNFYKSAKKEKTITSIEIQAIDQNTNPVFEKKSICYNDFDNCILTEEQKKTDAIIDAKIYIVSPVLIRGRKDYWKGIFNDKPIEFRVSDKVFLNYVYNHVIKFSNGTFIICKMKVTTTTYSNDENDKISRNIIDVTEWGDDENMIHSVVKRKRRSDSNINNSNQGNNLFSGIN